MENQEHFGRLTDRMATFREEVLEEKPYIDAERAVLATQAYKENQNQPRVMVRALMLQKILENMSIYIEDKSLIAGNQATKNKNAPIFPEYTMEFVMNELDLFEKRDGDVFYITEETKQQLRDIAPFWENNNLRARGEALLPDEVSVFMETGVFGMEGKLNAGDAHLAVNYERILAEGLKGYEERTKKLKAALDFTKPESIDKNVFYKAVLIVIDAVHTFANRYSKLAQDMALTETDAKRKEELLEISRICAKVPYEPASSFREAVQAVWFIQLILQIESNGHSFCYGRFDQYMYDLYEKDIASGKISKEKALEYIIHMFLMNSTNNKVRGYGHTKFSQGYPLYSNLVVGGYKKDGTDGTNDLSYLCVEAMNMTAMAEPNFSMRYNKTTPVDLLRLAARLIRTGCGMPSMFNDEVAVKGLVDLGIPHEDALDYCPIGCVETGVPGMYGHRATGMTYVNWGKVLEIVLNHGNDPKTDIKLIDLGDKEYASYDEVWAAWEKALKYYSDLAVESDAICDRALVTYDADPFASCFIDNCMALGKTLKEGGCKYDVISQSNIGPCIVGNSLSVVKKLVFEDKTLSMDELMKAMASDWAGEEGIRIHKMVMNVPKFGNDEDYVDEIVADVFHSYLKLLPDYHTERTGKGPEVSCYTMSTSNITSYVPNGFDVNATPD